MVIKVGTALKSVESVLFYDSIDGTGIWHDPPGVNYCVYIIDNGYIT